MQRAIMNMRWHRPKQGIKPYIKTWEYGIPKRTFKTDIITNVFCCLKNFLKELNYFLNDICGNFLKITPLRGSKMQPLFGS
jgi:hypothetical protein